MWFFAQLASSSPSVRVRIDCFSPSTQWSTAKPLIAKLLDQPLSRCRFLHKGKILEDGLGTLYECRIKADDVLIVQEIPQFRSEGLLQPPREDLDEPLRCVLEPDVLTVGLYVCENCQKDPSRGTCQECGCNDCGVKDDGIENIVCEECDHWFHWSCLEPQLTTLPEDNWFCQTCKNDNSSVIQPGHASLKRKSTRGGTKNNCGRGMSNVGHTKHCTIVPPTHRGPIPGIVVGQSWKFRLQCGEDGVHRPPVAGIAGSGASGGAVSIVLSDGYPEDVDRGEEFIYTGSGGRDLSTSRTALQSFDQELKGANLHLAATCNAKVNARGASALNWRNSKPIRVVRSHKLKRWHPEYAPDHGYRYDGIYKLVKYYSQKGQSGHTVFRYEFRRDDESPAPWTSAGKLRIEELGLEMIYPEGIKSNEDALAVKRLSQDQLTRRAGLPPDVNVGRNPRKRAIEGCSSSLADDSSEEECILIGVKRRQSGPTAKAKQDSMPLALSHLTDLDHVHGPMSSSSQKSTRQTRPLFASSPSSFSPYWTLPEELKSLITEAALSTPLHSSLFKRLLGQTCRDLRGFIALLEKELECPICKDFVQMPVTNPCGHLACLRCLGSSVKSEFGPRCPLCRASLLPLEQRTTLDGSLTSDLNVETRKDLWRKTVKIDRALVSIVRFCVPEYCNSLVGEENKLLGVSQNDTRGGIDINEMHVTVENLVEIHGNIKPTKND